MSAPLKPHWHQPSHPAIQQVVLGGADEGDFSSKSLSKVRVAPFGVFADMTFPPCTLVAASTYATVQISRDRHILLNSDLLYLNHSCEPSLILDTSNMQILAGPKGLEPGDELTFFYPSTEWHMAQPFSCACATPSCRGLIGGAEAMSHEQLAGYWLSGHIRALKQEQQQQSQTNGTTTTTIANEESEPSSLLRPPPPPPQQQQQHSSGGRLDRRDPTVQALQEALAHAEKVVIAAKTALVLYLGGGGETGEQQQQQQQQQGR